MKKQLKSMFNLIYKKASIKPRKFNFIFFSIEKEKKMTNTTKKSILSNRFILFKQMMN